MKSIGRESWVDAAQYVVVALFAYMVVRDAFEAFSFKALIFGAVVTNSATADVDASGAVLSLTSN